MADGSPEDRAGPDRTDDLTFSAADSSFRDSKQCTEGSSEPGRFRLSFYTELEPSDSCEISETRGVVADRSAAAATSDFRKTTGTSTDHGDDRKKRRFDRYDSSESSDSGVAVLSPTESSGCSSSDITEPRSPRSPESACSTSEEGVGTRMPPWASDPAPQGPRRLAAQPAPLRRPNPSIHRRITEYFNHKMKPQNSVKRDTNPSNGDTKKKCLSKNGVTHDLEKYISYLSKTLSPKLLDVGKQEEATLKINQSSVTADSSKTDLNKTTASTNINGVKESRFNDSKDVNKLNGFMEVRHGIEAYNREKNSGATFNGLTDNTKQIMAQGPSASVTANVNKSKVPIPASFDLGLRIAPATSMNHPSPKKQAVKRDSTKLNGVVSSTTKLDSRMNGVTCGSNNLNLINKPSPLKKEPTRRKPQTSKRTNRKSSACIANSKNLTWSKANNLKQVQMQKQNCTNSLQVQLQNQNCKNLIHSSVNSIPGEASTAPKINIPNGVRQVSMTVNGSLGNMNVPVANLQNCHQINIPQPCNGTVASNNLASFVAVPQNVMLTTLRIPQNGLPPQTNLNLNQQGNIAAFNRTNVNVSSPTKLNGQFVFPLMQNINGTVLQIPNLMAKMPNFVLPQNPQITAHRPDHLQNQQPAQILLNGTLLKLANTIPSTYTTPNKSSPVTSQPMPVMNKNIPGLQAVGLTVQPKPNYGVNLSHPVLVPQSGFIMTSVPNINVKETWSYTNTTSVSTSQITCSNPIVHHPQPMMSNFSPQTLHSSIPLARVKPPDNPIQGTEPPSSTVKEPEFGEVKNIKCDFPWLSKTMNNNIVPLDSNKILSRPFAQVSSCSGNIELSCKIEKEVKMYENNECKVQSTTDEIRKVEEVARREDTIFTQITVLKDVSSNVQNSVIEANFCSTTTESSESGIGTDKSIDSPSDSQASKECDEDSSSLSLSISVSSVEAQSCQKSPILKQPKILRFPPKSITKTQNGKRASSTDTTSVTVCLWENCKRKFESDSDLLEHLQSTHVEPQVGIDQTNYVCLWEKCKVRGKPSCSRLWLERHALSHGGNKPFKCIVDGCDRRFSKQTLLVRHVNNHFNEVSSNNANKKSTDSSSKLIRRNGKKLRYRRQPWSARMFDFFDTGMMEGLAWRLSRCTRWRLGGACPLREPPGRHTLTLHAALAATRYNAAKARREALLTYYPPHVIEDEWVPENEVKRIKRVEISELPVHTKVLLYEQFCSSYRKTPSPPPMRKAPVVTSQPVRLLPPRQCTSSRLLNNLIAKQRKERNDCSATNMPMEYNEDSGERVEVSGAKKRKMGRRYGGNSFMPCGR